VTSIHGLPDPTHRSHAPHPQKLPLPLPPGTLPLTRRESVVLAAVAGGCTTDEISQSLAITPECVRLRLHRVAMKIGEVPGRGHLVHRALAYRQIPLPGPQSHDRPRLPVDQWTILHCIAAGMSSQQTAWETAWSARSVRILTGLLLNALNARTIPHTVHRAWATGLLGSPTALRPNHSPEPVL
jgi:DNA-binding NarL/FixJ family response regulator